MNRHFLMAWLFISSLLFFGGSVFAADSEKLSGKDIAKFVEVLRLIDKEYYKSVDINACVESIFKKGISECTDPFSFYLNDKEKSRDIEFREGSFGGIGLRMFLKETDGKKEILVVEVFPGTPAEKAGLQAGDVIIAVSASGKVAGFVPVEGMEFLDAVNLIKGKPRTSVALRVIRGNVQLDFLMVRSQIKDVAVTYKQIDSGIGYVKIHGFSGIVEKEFYVAVDSLMVSGVNALIIDVRNNPGGLMRQVLGILSAFSSEADQILETRGRNNSQVFFPGIPYTESSKKIFAYRNLKVVVLVNAHSASASEILACWFKEDFKAPIVGEKTFGKGLVQSLIELSDGGMLHLTTAEYFVGVKKVPVQGIGVTPTFEVKNSTAAVTEAEDRQLQKALEVAKDLLKSE